MEFNLSREWTSGVDFRSLPCKNQSAFLCFEKNSINVLTNELLITSSTIGKMKKYKTIGKVNKYKTIGKVKKYKAIGKVSNYKTIDKVNKYKTIGKGIKYKPLVK